MNVISTAMIRQLGLTFYSLSDVRFTDLTIKITDHLKDRATSLSVLKARSRRDIKTNSLLCSFRTLILSV